MDTLYTCIAYRNLCMFNPKLILLVYDTDYLKVFFYISISYPQQNTVTTRNLAFLSYCSSSSSMGATTLGGFWPTLQFRSTIFYLYTSLSSFSLSSSLDPLLLGQAIPVLVFLLVLMSVVPIRLLF